MMLAKSGFVDANSRRRCEDCSFQTEKSPLSRSLKNTLAWNIVELEVTCFCCLFSELDSRVMQDDACKSSFVDANSRRRCEDCSFQTEKSPLGRSLKNKLAWNTVELEMPCFCCLFSELDSRVMQDDACKE